MAKSKNRSQNSAHSGRSAAPHGQHHGAPDDAQPRRHNATDEFGGAIKLAFRDHNWPASRKALLEHARHNTALDKSDLARLEKIPDRKYKSVVDLVNATRDTAPSRPAGAPRPERAERQEVGHVASAESNRRAAGDMAMEHEYSSEYRNDAAR
jgi:hypothetical protein